jgi:hypothetical protein
MNYQTIIISVIIINGLYNIITALTILDVLKLPYIRQVYFDMITDYDNTNLLFERFVAYSMLTNGLIRVFNGSYLNSKINRLLVSGTFFLESIIYFNESIVYQRIDLWNAVFSILFSLYLGYFVITI